MPRPYSAIETDQILRTGQVIERFSHLEALIDRIIFDYIAPTIRAEDFLSLHMLHNSIIPFGSKIKLIQLIDTRTGAAVIDRETLHKTSRLRNAFAHNTVEDRVDFDVLDNGLDVYFFVETMKGSGELKRMKRDEAFKEFHAAADELLTRLKQLHAVVSET